ncbi:ATP-grasp domain-containing protein [Ornithinibacillus gellani]|uniref:ATP-grasp domain-containing protein n=1 Tax=Ornithinibacillus gellani TaxID=2293253 RepID=UPI000F464088|nr:ATP-grasp domain-containing protein [Ornithinibacillus gellani]TQS71170.1 ATP-grasp domain-containing protein [Ornithinibacillus gellani]
MKKKILILGVASVQMDAIMELKKMGYETHACAMKKDGPGADAADYFVIINILNINEIIEYIEENKISVVYSVGSDLAMPIASQISEKLNLPHFVSEKTARICNNKDLMRSSLGSKFNGNVNYQVIHNVSEKVELSYPFILKPTDSQGQRGVKLINSQEEYLKYFKKAKDYSRSGNVILEQYISGPEISVNGYVVNGEVVYLETSDRETWSKYTGLIHKHVVPAKNCTSQCMNKINKIVNNACEKLGISNGPVYAQMKMEGDTPYIIEITPRLDGCHMWKILSYYSGMNLLKLTFNHLINNDISELNKVNNVTNSEHVLEFICQEPNTKANFSNYQNEISNSIYSFNYYNPGDTIREINGQYEKIGYFIYKN